MKKECLFFYNVQLCSQSASIFTKNINLPNEIQDTGEVAFIGVPFLRKDNYLETTVISKTNTK